MPDVTKARVNWLVRYKSGRCEKLTVIALGFLLNEKSIGFFTGQEGLNTEGHHKSL